jgi:hypothetical protein
MSVKKKATATVRTGQCPGLPPSIRLPEGLRCKSQLQCGRKLCQACGFVARTHERDAREDELALLRAEWVRLRGGTDPGRDRKLHEIQLQAKRLAA